MKVQTEVTENLYASLIKAVEIQRRADEIFHLLWDREHFTS